MKIGLTRLDYPEVRCIKTSSSYNYKNLKANNFYGYCKRIPIIKNVVEDFLYLPVIDMNVDLYHTFNYVCVTKKKWVATYETMMPRFLDIFNDIENHKHSKKIELYLTKLSQANCLALLPISECTKKIQGIILSNYPHLKKIIEDKTVVLYPPQKSYYSEKEIEQKKLEKVKFLFVGNDFFRKGGGEIIEAFDQLFRSGELNPYSVEVNLIGDIGKRYNYALNKFQHDVDYFDKIESILNENPSINVIKNLDNDSVIKLMKSSNVGILTTWADTFGYSVLEFQATGCPVITTNIRALPEINSNDVGWVINVDKDIMGNVKISSYQDVVETKSKIISGLKEAILDAVDNKNNIKDKGMASIRRINKFHNIEKYNEILAEIYNREP